MDAMDDTETLRSVQAENEQLKRRIAELEGDAARARDGEEPRARFLEQLIDEAPLSIYAKDVAGRYILVNQFLEELSKKKRAVILGKTSHELAPKAHADIYVDVDRQILDSGKPQVVESAMPVAGQDKYLITSKYPLRDAEGKVFAICGITTEVTRLTKTYEENQRLQREIIRIQEESLRALSTPLLPIAAGVVIMPLIGAIDRGRAELVLDALLRGVTEHRAEVVILDITGVPVVDSDVANALARAARATRLLGAEAVLTGVKPKIARTLVDLGVELGEIVIKGTLQSGVAYALGHGG